MINSKEIYLPNEFIEKYESLLGKQEAQQFFESCRTRLTKSLRINKIKCNSINDMSYFEDNNIILKNVEYLKNAYFIESEVSALGNSIEQLLGYFQIQEISSMLPAFVLNPKEGEIVLDLTAAPGNKTSYMAQLMKNKGLIVANDIDKKRLKVLNYTLKKLGITNTIITNKDGTKFNLNNIKFDKILLDAPCSCEGTIRKKIDSLKDWNEKLVLSKSLLQKKLIDNCYKLLKSGGTLVYSTCTLSPQENEEVIDYILNKYKDKIVVENIDLDSSLNYDFGLIKYNNKEYNTQIEKSIRIWPHHSNLEGFYICKLKKI